jgi:hypothetical protein
LNPESCSLARVRPLGNLKVIKSSVAEPDLEPVEQQLFAGAGAKVFFLTGSGSGAGYKNSYKMLQKPYIFHIKV